MKKIFSIFATLLIAVVFVSCGKKEKITVTMWTFAKNNKDEWDAREKDIEKKFNIDLKIELVAQNAFVQKLQAVMMDKKGVPQIIEWLIEANKILDADPNKCFVMPLNKYTDDSSAFQKVPKGRTAWVTYGEHVYGLPHDVHPVILIYNDTIWKKEAGTDVAKIKTWDEFFEAAKKLISKKKAGKPVHYALPYGNDGLANTMFMIWQQTGAQILTKDGKPQFSSPKFAAFVKKWLSWQKTGVFTSWDWGNFGALLKKGTLCSYTSPDWWVSQSNEAAKVFNMRVRELPVYSDGGPTTSSWGGSFLAIPRSEENVNNADRLYEIIEFLQYDQGSLITRWETANMLPPFEEVWDNDAFKKPDSRFGGQKLGVIMSSAAKNMPEVVSGDVFWDALGDFSSEYTEIATGKKTVEEGLKAADAKVMKRLNK
jgi:ABC-type glycerol-3-phosphate transport system substrate-binding protein